MITDFTKGNFKSLARVENAEKEPGKHVFADETGQHVFVDDKEIKRVTNMITSMGPLTTDGK